MPDGGVWEEMWAAGSPGETVKGNVNPWTRSTQGDEELAPAWGGIILDQPLLPGCTTGKATVGG